MAKTPIKSAEHSFESALDRLERIVEEMEGDKLPLEELLGRYEEGTRLVKVCQERISSAEKRIELISRNASGEVQLNPFDPGASSSTSFAQQSSPSATASADAAHGAPASAPRSSSRKAPPEDSNEVSLF